MAQGIENNLLKAIEQDEVEVVQVHGTDITPAMVCQLSSLLKKNKSVKKLEIINSSMSNAGAFFLGAALRVNSTISQLDLSGSSIGNKGLEHIANAISTNNTLEYLGLSKNGIGALGSIDLFWSLRNNQSLTELDLSLNNIHLPAYSRMKSVLFVNENLRVLNLTGNNIGNEGAILFAEALERNKWLRKLSLGSAQIGTLGAFALAKALKRAHFLEELDLSDNAIRVPGIEVLIEMVKENPKLIVLNVSRNGIPLEFQNSLNGLLQNNINKLHLQFKFFETLNKNETSCWNRARVMIVGQAKAGKSSLVRSMLNERFDPVWNSTVGVSIVETETSITREVWKKSKKEDNASEFAARIMIEQTSQASVVQTKKPKLRFNFPTFSRSGKPEKASKEQEMMHEQELETISLDQDILPNQSKQVRKEIIQRDFNESLITEAAFKKNDLTLSLWDFGGQNVFYTMHHIFLSAQGVYVIAFDMKELAEETTSGAALEYVGFWLKSIRLHAPDSPICIVGTFAHEAAGNGIFRSINRRLLAYVGDEFPQIVKNSSDRLLYFPCDNKDGFGILRVRKTIEEIALAETIRPERHISMRMVVFLDKILERAKSSEYLDFGTVKEIGLSIGITGDEIIRKCLNVFHQRGLLVYLSSTEALRNIVVINPQWLVDNLSKVIRDGSVHRLNEQEVESKGLVEDMKMTYERGFTTLDFLQYVWGKQHQGFFLDLMRQTMLLCEWRKTQNLFLVPSVLQTVFVIDEIDELKCTFDFKQSFLPNGVFQQIMCMCVAHSALKVKDESLEKEPMWPFRNYLSIELEPGFNLKLLEDHSGEKIHVFIENERFASRSVQVLQSMLYKVNVDFMNSRLLWETFVEEPDTENMVSYEEARRRSLKPWCASVEKDGRNQNLSSTDILSFLESL